MSRHLVDPELIPFVESIPPLVFSDATIPKVRQMLESALIAAPEPPLRPTRVRAHSRRTRSEVDVLVFDPPNRKSRAAIVHIHGGGTVVGTAASSNTSNASIALDHDVLVVSVDYRLAPECPFPGPQVDCLTAYEWVIENSSALKIDIGSVIITGESAGGGLAAATSLMVRDEGLPMPRMQLLTYPMLDYRTGTAVQPGLAATGEFIWTREMNSYCWAALRGSYACDDERVGWYSPAVAANLSGLAPTFIATGALDLFLEENVNFACRLIAARVPVEFHVYPGAVHAFDQVFSAAVSRQYRRDRCAAIRTAFGTT